MGGMERKLDIGDHKLSSMGLDWAGQARCHRISHKTKYCSRMVSMYPLRYRIIAAFFPLYSQSRMQLNVATINFCNFFFLKLFAVSVH